MKWLVVHTDYPAFLEWHYARSPELIRSSFNDQLLHRYRTMFAEADSFSYGLETHGHEVLEVFVNNEPMQRQWCIENGVQLPPSIRHKLGWRRGVLPWISTRTCDKWQQVALQAQIQRFNPDVIFNLDMFLPVEYFEHSKKPRSVLIGQHAATRLPHDRDWSPYRLVLSSFPATVDWFLRRNVNAVYNKLAFDPRVLERIPTAEKKYALTFVGSLQQVHNTRLQLLETICETFEEFRWWSPDRKSIPQDSPLHERFMGTVWGAEMYDILNASDITINEHGAVAAYANNYRLYEATGLGTCLVTDWKENLETLFQPEEEVVTYKTPSECVSKVRSLLENAEMRRGISDRGRQRTLREHTFSDRIRNLIALAEQC